MINTSINTSFFDRELIGYGAGKISPTKITINSLDTIENGVCIGGDLVSNLNCPKEIPFCNCDIKTLELIPTEKEPTDTELLKALEETKECWNIRSSFKDELRLYKFLGYDYSNPTSSYNCSCDYFYFSPKTKGFTFTFYEDYDNLGYFSYARRKSYTDGLTIYAFPSNIDVPSSPPVKEENDSPCKEQKIIGEYFKYYLEYSKTNATFWNTPPQTPLLRQAQTNALMSQRIKILVNGSFEIKPGSMISINYPTGEHPTIKNSRFAGDWMVYKVKRIINAQKHSMYLFLMRDSRNNRINEEVEQLLFSKGI